MKTLNKLILSAFIPLAVAPMTGNAVETPGSVNWANSSGTYWRSTSGECVRSSYWTPALATEACDAVKKAEVAPVVVAKAEPAPAPTPAPVPDRVTTRGITLSTEDLFEFNKSELKPEGKAKLDELISKMQSTDNEEIVATGHADRIGNKEYNQKLSERRAETVREYLIAGGLSADQVRAEGKGESDPVTKLGECKGSVSKKLIACLQPDRRVDVEVKATKTFVVSGS